MRKLPVLSGAFVAAALVVAACTGTTTPTIPPVNIPSLAVPSFAIPSIAIGSFAIPSFAIPSFAIPSFTGDPTLAAKFPTTVGGKTVSPPQTALYASIFTAFGGSYDSQRFVQAMTSIGIDPNTVSYGTATVDLTTTTVISAIRTPNFSAAQFLSELPQISALLQPDQPAPTVGQVTIAGKTVTTTTDADEKVTYYYPSGDTVWTTDATVPADLVAIFTAIQ